ncbi:MAG TPA: Hsp20/alpha crystallin family protein [Candidatus Eisenbacteria bacterium]|nr:Hsp20/alpha crystallin family protein [Candidatus Eisenbacteria bacterium]
MNETESIDNAIGQVERLYRSVTGRDAPPIQEQQPYAVIPPEKVPEEHIQEQVDRLVETLMDFSGQSALAVWKPPISIWEGRGEVVITMDLPGVTRDGVHVSVTRGMLDISGVRPARGSQDGNQVELRYNEHIFGRFRRLIPIAQGLATDRLQAQMRSGVLEIRLPRAGGTQDVKSVPVG